MLGRSAGGTSRTNVFARALLSASHLGGRLTRLYTIEKKFLQASEGPGDDSLNLL